MSAGEALAQSCDAMLLLGVAFSTRKPEVAAAVNRVLDRLAEARECLACDTLGDCQSLAVENDRLETALAAAEAVVGRLQTIVAKDTARIVAQGAEVKRLRGLMREARDDFHGKSVLFSARYLAALTPNETPCPCCSEPGTPARPNSDSSEWVCDCSCHPQPGEDA